VSLHDTIEGIYEKDGLDDLWRWAKGHTDRWEGLKQWAKTKVHFYENERESSRERREEAADALERLGEEAADIRDRIAQNRDELQQAERAADDDRIRRLHERQQELTQERDKLTERMKSQDVRRHKAFLRAEHAKDEQKAWIERKIIYRDKWEAAKQREKPEWEDFMASGHPLNFDAAAKAEAAIAVVKFDCVVTSTYRSTVLPQSNPDSFHGPNVNPGKAVDVAGSRMTQYQQDVFDRRRGDAHLLELFGPNNSLWLRLGNQQPEPEGTFLENLHDTHVHVAADG
jgi:hypothetical protein